ncbi:helix-turn-helix domain-containing protein [Pseudogemmobacter sp. CC-YST710]|uniref:Helix-turn-helix domain-containing protein n=1 Tax=Pseudogemmobacter faecipullorum TaxID=2755041 RepID=A0ABS8CNP9_9RHOB|nr:helix-turn-helix domain-containing protein [Pseudogemmobacter faecipullorum]
MAKVYSLRGARPGGWAKDRWEWSKRVRRDGDLSPMARLVAHSLAIGFAKSETAECRLGAATLAEDCATSVPTIERAMRDLERAGWIERKGGNAPGVRAAIRFCFPEDRHATATEHPSDFKGEQPSFLPGEQPSDPPIWRNQI